VEQLLEMLVFLFLVGPTIALSFFAIRQGSLSFRLTAASIMLRDLGLVSLIIFFLWRNREPVKQIGWTFRNGWCDIVLGTVLFAPMYYGTAYLDRLLTAAGLSAPATPVPQSLSARSPTEFLLAGFLVVVVAIAEEVIFRGYLILRLQEVTGSSVAAAILSSIIFSLGHGYEGTAGLITVGSMGLFFALVYLSRRSLVAPIVLHFLQDFLGIVVVPLLKHHQ
jgi:membrane protease YdiL (CAAX protease family)